MADDLVAELTLRLQNQMSAGLEEIRNELTGLSDPLTALTESVGSLDAELSTLAMPSALADGMADVAGGADQAAAAVAAIGAALDVDVGKLQALREAWGGAGAGTFLPPGAQPGDPGYVPAFIPPGTPPPNDPEPNPDPRPRPTNPALLGGASMLNEAFFGLIGADVAEHFANSFADYDWTLTHIAITEKLSGAAAEAEKQYLGQQLDQLALQYGNSSTDLADAYSFLITTGMNKNLIQQMMPALAETATAYNVPVLDQAQAVFTLNDQMKIAADDMPQALAMLAYSAKLGHFTVADFGAFLPEIGSRMELLGAGGLSGEATAAAALQIVRRVTPDSGTDATDVRDALMYITSPTAARFFDRTQRSKDLLGPSILHLFDEYHVKSLDLPEYLDTEKAKGIDPLSAMVDYLHSIGIDKFNKNFSGTGSDEAFVLGSLLHNQQAATAFMGLINNYDDFNLDKKILSGVTSETVSTDSATAQSAPKVGLEKLEENFRQLGREVGEDLIPTFDLLGVAVNDFRVGLEQIGKAWGFVSAPIATGLGTTAAHVAHEIDQHLNGAQRSRFGYNEPMALHITVTPTGQTTVTPRNLPPGSSVRVNQGQVLGNP